MSEPLVSVRNLQRYFWEGDSLVDRLLLHDPVAVQAVDGVSFDIHRGETLGLVGESGCGKSTVGETLLRLQEPSDGSVYFDGENVFEMSRSELKAFRRQAQFVFQDPDSSLNPRMNVGQIVREPLDIHDVDAPAARDERVQELLERVGLSADQFDRYPNEFSGGQQQRVAIARALALQPEFLVLDEPTSALDVSVQAQVLNLLLDLQEEFDLTYLLISHDLSVIRQMCDRVAVMYLGELVEIGDVQAIFEEPAHPYTKALLESVPRADAEEQHRDRQIIAGDVPSPRDPPSGCRFRTRCPEIIPPDGLSIEQRQYREIMSVRQRIEAETLDIEAALASFDTEEVSALSAADREQLAADVIDRLVEIDLPSQDERILTEAVRRTLAGEHQSAIEELHEHYESPCESHHPELKGDGHLVACHLHHPPQPASSPPDQ